MLRNRLKEEKKGTVTLPVGEYDKMMADIIRFRNAIQVRVGYRNNLEAYVDLNLVRDVVEDKMLELPEFDPENYEVENNFYVQDTTIAKKKEDEEE